MKNFDNREDAETWMEDQVDDPCTDNYRFAFLDDADALAAYERKKEGGCCGAFDKEITIRGRKAVIGCNYGH